MKLKKPKFWDYKKPNIFSFLLLPFTLIVRINNFFKKLKKNNINKKIKTICIGNIYIGGTGKTPSVIKVNQILKKLNYKTVFIKKYYKDSIDEQILLEKNGKTITYKKRSHSLNVANTSGHDVAIFDDGLQDSSIKYDLKFVCFNIQNFIGNGFLIPAGPLREKIDSLKKYDAVLLNGNNENSNEPILEIKKNNKDIKIFESTYTLTNLDLFNKKNKYVAFAGIGIPMNFYKTLTNNGLNIIKFLEYPDHYDYSYNDIEKIKNKAKNLEAEIITTEKDYLRMEKNQILDIKKDIQIAKMELKIKNEDELINFLKNYL